MLSFILSFNNLIKMGVVSKMGVATPKISLASLAAIFGTPLSKSLCTGLVHGEGVGGLERE